MYFWGFRQGEGQAFPRHSARCWGAVEEERCRYENVDHGRYAQHQRNPAYSRTTTSRSTIATTTTTTTT